MRVAALYDVHANLPALEAVLAEVEPRRTDYEHRGGDGEDARPARPRSTS